MKFLYYLSVMVLMVTHTHAADDSPRSTSTPSPTALSEPYTVQQTASPEKLTRLLASLQLPPPEEVQKIEVAVQRLNQATMAAHVENAQEIYECYSKRCDPTRFAPQRFARKMQPTSATLQRIKPEDLVRFLSELQSCYARLDHQLITRECARIQLQCAQLCTDEQTRDQYKIDAKKSMAETFKILGQPGGTIGNFERFSALAVNRWTRVVAPQERKELQEYIASLLH